MVNDVNPSAVTQAYGRLAAASRDAERIVAAAALILAIFDDFYGRFRQYSAKAKQAFESMDPHASINISKERLGLYTRYIAHHGPRIGAHFPALCSDSSLWDDLDRLFVAMIVTLKVRVNRLLKAAPSFTVTVTVALPFALGAGESVNVPFVAGLA